MTSHSLAEEAIVIEESRRTAAERLHDAEVLARVLIVGQTFLYRDEMQAYLVASCEVATGHPLAPSGIGMMHAVAIGLWSEYARARGIDCKMITEEQHTLVTKAQAQRTTAPRRVVSVRDARRTMDAHAREHPELDIRNPANDRKLERRRD